MAIQKPYLTRSGIALAEAYWSINNTRIEKPSQNVIVEMAIHKDAAARQAGFDAVEFEVFRLQRESYPDVVQAGFPAIYNALKSDQLQGGIDV
jgi:hypothetical protein